ncbi:hypothetical protein EWI07_14365 [Sporolactobacillus sp. THM7-4]|nr:hypothetical protein EWI07_14365 [Sporolactobacillus sp. THM7-4]
MIDINLLPYEKRTSKAMIRLITGLSLCGVLVFAGMVWYGWHLDGQLQQAKQQESLWKARSTENKTQTALASTQAAMQQLKSSSVSLHQALETIEQELPDKSVLQSADFEKPNKLTLTLSLPAFSDIETFTDQLRQQPFDQVETDQILNPKAARSGQIDVSLTVNISQKDNP